VLLKRRREQSRSKLEERRDLRAKGRVMMQVENEMNERAFLKLCGVENGLIPNTEVGGT
jgi:hypothetical protein